MSDYPPRFIALLDLASAAPSQLAACIRRVRLICPRGGVHFFVDSILIIDVLGHVDKTAFAYSYLLCCDRRLMWRRNS